MTTSLFKAALLIALMAAGFPATPAYSQEETGAGDEEAGASQETDVNEDNYRRFMELRDQQRQRPSAPYAVLAPPANLEKMDKLPEASQKHLRNELLGIILEGGRWTPEEAGKDYPYTPSEAAASDARLRNMESEAWDELVQNYHARESEIYQAGERARSATVSDGINTAPRSDNASASDASTPQSRTAAGSSTHGASAATQPEGQRQAGTTQSALEYLTGNRASSSSATTDAARQAATSGAAASSADPSAARANRNVQADKATAGDSASTAQQASTESAAQSATTGEQQNAQQIAQSDTSEDPQASAASQAANPNSADSENRRQDEQDTAPDDVVYESAGVIAIRDLDKVKGTEAGKNGKKKDKED